MRCPKCDSIMRRLRTSSEPEGIRRDALCTQCKTRYMVTKAGEIPVPEVRDG